MVWLWLWNSITKHTTSPLEIKPCYTVSSRMQTLQTFSLLWGKRYLLFLKFEHVRGDCIGLARYAWLQSCQWQFVTHILSPLEIGPCYVSPRKVNTTTVFTPWGHDLSSLLDVWACSWKLHLTVGYDFDFNIRSQNKYLLPTKLDHATCLPKKFEC